MTDDIARILPSASLMLAVLAVLMNMWHKDVTDALKQRTGSEDLTQKKALRKSLTSILFWKALPLAAAGGMIFLIFRPPAWALLQHAFTCRRAQPVCEYDPLAAAFLGTYALIALVLVVLASHVLRLLWAMR